MDYLLYVSHDAENLQFYLWFEDYSRRFHQASQYDQALSPPWDDESLAGSGAPFTDTGPRLQERNMDQTAGHNITFDSKDIALSPLDEHGSWISGSMGTKIKQSTLQSVDFASEQNSLKWQSCTTLRTS